MPFGATDYADEIAEECLAVVLKHLDRATLSPYTRGVIKSALRVAAKDGYTRGWAAKP